VFYVALKPSLIMVVMTPDSLANRRILIQNLNYLVSVIRNIQETDGRFRFAFCKNTLSLITRGTYGNGVHSYMTHDLLNKPSTVAALKTKCYTAVTNILSKDSEDILSGFA